jgi:DNA-binding FadR family transcriptional regulator
MLRGVKASIAIAAEIRGRIARGDLQPGDPLPVEGELTESLSCSKPVVREALRILETEGLVEVRRGVGGGARVRQPSISDAAKTMGVYLQIGDVPVLDIWAARDRIIAAAIQRLAEADLDLSAFEHAVGTLQDSVGDLVAFNDRLLDVGEAAVRLAGNATEHVLVAALRHIIEEQVARARQRIESVEGYEYALREQGAIAEAWQRLFGHLRSGNGVGARRAYEEHAGELRRNVGAATAWQP